MKHRTRGSPTLRRKSRSRSRGSPRRHRGGSLLGRYDDSSDERLTPEKTRRRRTPSPRRYSPHRDYPGSSREYGIHPEPFKVLCITGLHHKASDDLVKDILYREYRKFGDFSIKISREPETGERLAYVCFKMAEDAWQAKRHRPEIVIYEKVAVAEPIYERYTSRTPEPERFYRLPPEERILAYEHHHGHHPYGPPPGGLPYHRDFRPPHEHHLPPGAPHHHYEPPHFRGPPLGPPGPHQYYGPPLHHMLHNRFRPPNLGYYDKDQKKEKFPNYLQHIPPEDDPLATRTLFAGNLELNISDEELRRIFGRYGIVEDIDIKRPLPGTGNAYAFVRYQNLDMAHRSKVELSGQYIGKFQVKIGYGKPSPTTRIWVGGLGSWTSLALLEREFDRFGAIKKIDYIKGDSQAYILYDSIDAATAAVKEMRGFALGGTERRLRVDFADVLSSANNSKKNHVPPGVESEYWGAPGFSGSSRSGWPRGEWEYGGQSPIENSVKTITDLMNKCSHTWSGALLLKNSLFPTKLYLIDGNPEIIDNLMTDSLLRITQRLRLDQPKLEDVCRRLSSTQSFAVFVAGSSNFTSDDTSLQMRPLKNLVSYLKQKEAAGVISLLNKDKEQTTGVLYSFPPCEYATDLLRKSAPNLTSETIKEDYLVIVVMSGGTP